MERVRRRHASAAFFSRRRAGLSAADHVQDRAAAARRAIARIEATRLGLDIRFVVTNPADGSAEWLYDSLYCARGQAENLIKLHKSQLASDRTSCRSPIANQVRLVLHTGAYWLMLTVRDAIPTTRDLAVNFGFNVRPLPCDYPRSYRGSVSLQFRLHWICVSLRAKRLLPHAITVGDFARIGSDASTRPNFTKFSTEDVGISRDFRRFVFNLPLRLHTK